MSEDEAQNQIAAMRAAMAQAAAGAVEFARIIVAYYKALTVEGMDSMQTLTLTLAYQSSLFAMFTPEQSE